MNILITGGAGYIGSHTCVEFLNENHNVIVIDNLSNSKEEAIKRVEEITNKKIKFYNNDIRDKEALQKIFKENKIDSVIHFAGLKAVGESVSIPLKYYDNNINGTITLLEVMKENNVKNFVFSSSATVYGYSKEVPFKETLPLSATNPYGRTKLIIEEILNDLYISDKTWSIALLRYFNPIGAHKSGKIGEDPNGIPNNLMPYITQVAIGKREKLSVFGNDYNTPDGTGVRDYIHVVDLAKGHLKAVEKTQNFKKIEAYNLGTGKGYSVLDLVKAFETANKIKIPYQITDRRAGDIDTCYSDPTKALKELNWKAEKNLEDMCRDSWNWQKNNPNGF
ncbi:UDP-glucose 4-epimerase GalE [Oceanotoga teriensis]|jgi:UDP-glucose 4-epimerase|uniref:UDP-glucose 4-epimerase n=1 Tax=Oceanotoga teriensis TaxID=515440 RepID=A0AA45HHG4_9BACT|nr:UDP-glucose 4-epimerase GalE [Oceanotoga teriensis]MDO7976498.1 UDP-glucose 4-epimerase GalE [Oceanotoga teriensis]PWJ86902.1 UDP-galactose 4-epimerase [Oceanotoga teriensis]